MLFICQPVSNNLAWSAMYHTERPDAKIGRREYILKCRYDGPNFSKQMIDLLPSRLCYAWKILLDLLLHNPKVLYRLLVHRNTLHEDRHRMREMNHRGTKHSIVQSHSNSPMDQTKGNALDRSIREKASILGDCLKMDVWLGLHIESQTQAPSTFILNQLSQP